MLKRDYSEVLGDWEGFTFGTVQRQNVDEGYELWVELYPRTGMPMQCSGCMGECSRVHDWSERWIRDLPVFEMKTRLLVHLRRVRCPRCGPKREHVAWLAPYARVTQRLAHSIARLCDAMSIRDVAEQYALNWKTVKNIHKAYLDERYADAPLPDMDVLIMDEFAVHRGKRYATVIMEPRRKQVVYVCAGRGVADLAPFFESLGPERCAAIQAVGMDMLGSYRAAIERYCPNARVVYDQFHVIVKYGKQVVRRVRAEQVRKLEKKDPMRKALYGTQWIFMRRPEHLQTQNEHERLTTILRNNAPLTKTYLMLADLRHLWDMSDEEEAWAFWKSWRQSAVRSHIDSLKRFAQKLDRYIDGIIAHAKYPLHTSLIEGVNNKIKVIKRMAYGYRDDEYFYLKIKHAFPGIGR